MPVHTDLIIIGGGAAGLMAGAAAGEAGLRTVILESRPKPGRKLLMCGNNRCNITSALSVPEMLKAYGPPVAPFLEPALQAFPPDALRNWFHENGLQTKIFNDRRVYPQSEKAADVHHLFTDLLARHGISLMLNTPAYETVPQPSGMLTVITNNAELSAPYVLIATGGVSYPKTGSVGDGQKMALALGHKVMPYRPGLAEFDMPQEWIAQNPVRNIPNVILTIISNGQPVATTRGDIEVEKYGISGPAVINASRIIARLNLKDYHFEAEYNGSRSTLKPVRVRPLKEAMVTIGGVNLSEINPQTMESKKVPGLFFAGEVLDIDGPSGGYNLQAAFSTARLAVKTISGRKGTSPKKPPSAKPLQREKMKGRTPYEKKDHQNRRRP